MGDIFDNTGWDNRIIVDGSGRGTFPLSAPAPFETATLQILLGEGRIEGLVDGLKSIYLDGTPILNSDGSRNFKGIAIALVAGTNTQPAVKGIGGVESEVSVNVQATHAASVTRSITSNPSAVRVRIAIPALKIVGSDGRSVGHSVTIKIERQNASYNGGAWEEVALEDAGVIKGGPYSTKFTRSFRIDLPASGTWQVKVSRVSLDDADAYHLSQTWWEAYTEIIDARLRYPNSAVLSLRVNANQFRNIPKVTCHLKMMRIQVPANYDPITRVYATTGTGTTGGAWDGTFKEAWSDNPAWIFYDAATKVRYGAGSFLTASALDKWTLYTIAQWCDTLVNDGKGGTEPRLTCHLYMQNQQNAIKALGQLASIFWGVIYYASGLVVPVADADTAPVAVFNSSNVIDGKFAYEGTARSARHTAAVVKFTNPDLGWEPDTAVYEDADGIARYGYNPLDLTALGCKSHGQALRLAKWSIFTELLSDETISFSSGLEGSTAKPGDVVQVHDQFRAGNVRFGGRVASGATTTVIPLDAPVTFGAGTHYLKMKSAAGVLETRTVTTPAGTVSSLAVSSAFSTTPAEGAVWLLQAGTAASLWRVLSIKKGDGIAYDIVALKHDPTKYALLALASGEVVPRETETGTSPAPSGLTAAYSTRILRDKQVQVIEAGWTMDAAKSYIAEASLDYGSWQPMHVSGASAVLYNVQPGDWKVRVFGVWPSGVSPAAEASMVVDYVDTKPDWIESALTPSVVADGTTAQYLVGVPAKRTNLIKYSQEFDHATWNKARAATTANAIASPDGTSTAEKLVEDTTASNDHYLRQTITKTATATTYTSSIYVKAGERSRLYAYLLHSGTFANRVDVAFDLATGTIVVPAAASGTFAGAIATITAVGGGWYRVTLTGTTSTEAALEMRFALGTTTSVYTGDGTSGLYLWGAQLETGSAATDYIPTLATPVSDYGITCEDWRGVWTLSPAPRTNSALYSEQFSNAAYVKSASSISGTAVSSPKPLSSAFMVIEDGATAVHGLTYTRSWVAGTTYSISIYAKAGARSVVQIAFPGTSFSNKYANFDLANGVVSGGDFVSASIEPVDGAPGWYRCKVTATATTSTSSGLGIIAQTSPTASRFASYAGNGTSGFYPWGFQIETGASCTPYIPTTTAAVTVTDITVSDSLATLSPAPLKSAILRGLSSNADASALAAAQAAALAAPAIVTDHAAITLPNATYPAGRIVYQTAGTPAGTLWQVNAAGTAWQTPALGVASLVGQLIAGQIAAGAINVTHLAAVLAIVGEIKSGGTGAVYNGTSSVMSTLGFKIAGTPFTAMGADGVTHDVCADYSGPVMIAGYLAETYADRVFQAFNRLNNGKFAYSSEPWNVSGNSAAWSGNSKTSGTGSISTVVSSTPSEVTTITQSFAMPVTTASVTLTLSTGFSVTSNPTNGTMTSQVKAYLLNTSTGTETLLGTWTSTTTASSQAIAWTDRSVDISSYVSGGGDFAVKIENTVSRSDLGMVTGNIDEVSIIA